MNFSAARPLVECFPDRIPRHRLFVIALPVIGGMTSLNILNLVDIGMVGRLGDTATGLGSFEHGQSDSSWGCGETG